MNFTITDLKKHLGPGLGLRKNKYMIEIPIPGIKGETLNVLCRSAGLPERNIASTPIWHKGRKYNVRGETDYGGTYQVSIVDDSRMAIRKVFDGWCKKVDDSKPPNQGILGASFEKAFPGALANVNDAIGAANQLKNISENNDIAGDYLLGLMDSANASPSASYQADINIWQLGNNGESIYGYKLQNAFPTQMGIVTLEDGDENTLSEFSVTFTFSEFTELENKSFGDKLLGSVLGDGVNDAVGGTEALFD